MGFRRELRHARGGVTHIVNLGKDLLGIIGCLAGQSDDGLCQISLSVNRSTNNGRHPVQLFRALIDGVKAVDIGLADGIDRLDFGEDFLRCACGIVRKLFHLFGHHGKTSTRFTCSCSLNGSIDGQEISLVGDSMTVPMIVLIPVTECFSCSNCRLVWLISLTICTTTSDCAPNCK